MNNVRIVSQGGLTNMPAMSYTAFPGGIVKNSDFITQYVNSYGFQKKPFAPGPLPTTAMWSFPICEIYPTLSSDVPMEFDYQKADFRLNSWILSDTSNAFYANLTYLFDQIPIIVPPIPIPTPTPNDPFPFPFPPPWNPPYSPTPGDYSGTTIGIVVFAVVFVCITITLIAIRCYRMNVLNAPTHPSSLQFNTNRNINNSNNTNSSTNFTTYEPIVPSRMATNVPTSTNYYGYQPVPTSDVTTNVPTNNNPYLGTNQYSVNSTSTNRNNLSSVV